jgi:hypothetical protein
MPIRDTRLLARAVMQRWPINPKMREGIIGALARVLTDPERIAPRKDFGG